MNNKTTLGIGYMILSGLFFGGVWFFSKIIIQDITPLTFTTLRMAVALFALCILGRNLLPQISTLSTTDWKKISLTAFFGMARGAIALTYSVKLTTVINSSFMFFLPVALLPVGGALFNKLKIKTTTYFAILLCIAGLYLLFDPNIIGSSIAGNLLGLLAGFSYATYIIGAKKLSYISPRLLSITIFIALTIILAFVTILIEGNQLASISLPTWIKIGYIGGCIAGAYFFLNKALNYLSSYLAGIHAIREPLAATALGILFLGEILTTSATLGLGAILLGFVLISVDKGLME